MSEIVDRRNIFTATVAPLLLCLITLALRLHGLPEMRYDYDHSYQHGVALQILDTIGTDEFRAVALHNQVSTLGVPNPVLATYLFAMVAALDRSIFAAVFTSICASTLAVLLVYALGKHMWGARVGLLAGFLAATSPWTIYLSQGAWQIGFFELSCVLPAYLWITAIAARSGQRFLLGSLAAAIGSHIYLVSFGLVLHMVIMLIVAGRRISARVMMLSAAAFIISIAAYLFVINANDPTWFTNPRTPVSLAAQPSPGAAGLVTSAFPNPVIFQRLFAFASGVGYAEGSGFIFDFIGIARAVAIGALLLLGLALALRRSKTRVSDQAIILWLAVPAAGVFLVTSLMPALPVHYYYLPIFSPAIFLLAAQAAFAMRTSVIGSFGILLALSGVFLFDRQAPPQIPDEHPSATVTLADAMFLARIIPTSCDVVLARQHPFDTYHMRWHYWTYSVAGTGRNVRLGAEAVQGSADSWLSKASGGSCILRRPFEPAVAPATRYSLPHGSAVLYVTEPYTSAIPAEQQLINNIGWRLIGTDGPTRLRPGEGVFYRQMWRIERLPDRAGDVLRYDIFAKLVSADGAVAAQTDSTSIPSTAWRVGDILVNRVHVPVPADLPPGAYRIELSSYDRSRGEVALFTQVGSRSLAEPGQITTVDVTVE
jgi:4-amino-4-deoxy-L-arabinose transferase-like glycosyltransferase